MMLFMSVPLAWVEGSNRVRIDSMDTAFHPTLPGPETPCASAHRRWLAPGSATTLAVMPDLHISLLFFGFFLASFLLGAAQGFALLQRGRIGFADIFRLACLVGRFAGRLGVRRCLRVCLRGLVRVHVARLVGRGCLRVRLRDLGRSALLWSHLIGRNTRAA